MVESFSFLKKIQKRRAEVFQQNLSDYLIAFIILFLPFSLKFTNYLLFVLALNWLIYVVFILQRKVPGNILSPAINIAPFIFSAISLIYCNDIIKGLHTIEKYLPLLSFPVILFTIGTQRNITFFFKVFGFTILSMAVVCFINGMYNLFFLADTDQVLVGDFFNRIQSKWNALTSTNLMRPFSINPIYMSLYVSFAFYIFLFKKFTSWIVKGGIILFLILFQLLIGSRIGLLAFFFTLIIPLFQMQKTRSRLYFLIFGAAIIMISITSIFINPVLKKRYISDLSAISTPETVEGWNALNIRVAIWKCSLQEIVKSPILGYGVSSQYDARDKCYKASYSFYGPFGTHLNSHNQYLEYTLIGGVILLTLFLIQLGYSLRIALRNGSNLHLIFMILIIITCLGESPLETHKGIVFFALFNSLFIYGKSTESDV